MRKIILGAVATLLAVAVAGAAPATYAPPFAAGPTGGDGSNRVFTEPETGRLTVLRAHPAPGAIGCAGQGGWAMWQVEHQADGTEKSVTVSLADAAWTPFTWVTVTARDQDGTFLGSAKFRGLGLHAAESQYAMELFQEPDAGDTLVVQFGIEVASACPNVDGGTARFTSVTIG